LPTSELTADLDLGGGGAGHGEIDLGDLGGSAKDDMEFADIPQERANAAADLRAIPEKASATPSKAAKTDAKPKRSLVLPLALGTLGLVGLGGGALSLTSMGPFGLYAIEEFLPAAGDATQVNAIIEHANAALLADTSSESRTAVEELANLRRDTYLNRALLRRSLLIESLYALRFGDDLGCAPRAAALKQRLETREPGSAASALAFAADQLRMNNAAGTSLLLTTAAAESPTDPFVDIVRGEAALASGDFDVADASFAAALQKNGGARAQWGIARALLGRAEAARMAALTEEAPEVPAAPVDTAPLTAAIDATLVLNPRHFDARIERARLALRSGDADAALEPLREAVGEVPVGDTALHTTTEERARALVLLGEVHETRGRLSQALDAYQAANDLGTTNPDALLGAGRMFLSQDRAAEALARFELVLGREDAAEVTTSTGRSARDEATLGAARAHMRAGNDQEARASLAALATTRANDPEVRLWFGRAEEALGHSDAAEVEYRECISITPTTFDGYVALASLYATRERPSDAQAVLDDARAHVPESASMRRQLGDLEVQRGALDAAVTEYRRALELDAGDTHALFGLATSLRRLGRLDAASTEFERLAGLDIGYPGLALERGLVFEARGDAGRAVEFYTRALEERPDAPDLILRLGAAEVSAGNLEHAEELLARVQAALPQSGEAEFFIGRIAFARGNLPDALSHLERAITLDGTPAEFRLYAGWAALESGNLGRALERIQQALERDPTLGDAFWLRGQVRLRTGAVQDALADFQQALTLKPGRFEAYAGIGECHDQLRQLPAAIAAYQRALEADAARADWWFRLGRLQLDASQTSAAIQSLTRATTLGESAPPGQVNPWLPDAHRVLGEAMQLSGERSGAIEHYRRYLEVAPAGAVDRNTVQRALAELGVQVR
jgi:tetratricopeptide (TPR) repeat protein